MKKILTALMVLSLSTSMTLAASTYGTNLKNAIKKDYQQTKSNIKQENDALKNSIKQDMQKKQDAKNAQAAAKKQEKIKQIDNKLNELNAEMKRVKADKTITETERTLKTSSLQRQINMYNKQKAALK